MRAVCLTIGNPFDPIGSRTERLIRRPMRIRTLAPKTGPVVAILNGTPLLRAGWRRRLRHDDVVLFARLPAGGNAGGGSNPARTLAMIALLAFAGGQAMGAIFGEQVLFGTVTAAKLGSVAVVLVGSAAINALFPTQTPKGLPTPSPTYSIDAQGNAARIGAVIPVQYGRLLTWPDLAAQPYTEFSGNDQFVYQLLCLGAGQFDIEEIRIEDTPISSFAEIESQIVEPGAQVTLFPTQVVTSTEVSGQELLGRKSATFSTSGTTITFTETAHNRASGDRIRMVLTSGTGVAGFYTITGIPDADTYTVTGTGWSGTGGVLVNSVLGGTTGFVASAAGTEAHHLGIDLVMPVGLYHRPGSGALENKSLSVQVQIQPIDDDGLSTGPWADLATISITDRTDTPIRKSYRYAVTGGRYQVRAWRIEEQSTDSADGHQCLLAGLRAYLVGSKVYPNVTLIALRMKATGNLSLQATRRISVISTRKLPIWNGSTWSAPTATRSIAWAIADAARNTIYGPGMDASELDLAALLALDALWAGRGDTFDGRFEQSGTWWEAVQSIARVGRSQCFMQGGILRVVRDGPATVPVALFSERNIKPDSFAIDYIMPTPDTADVIRVKYFDAHTWAERTVDCSLPGSTATKPKVVPMFGVTSGDQAYREGTYLAAVNRRRRRIARFETEMEGRLPLIGELIAIQHSMPAWGQQAEARAYVTATRKLTVSEPMTWATGTHYIALRRRDGSLCGPIVVTKGATEYDLILATAPDFSIEVSGEAVRTHVSFGQGDTWAARAKVASVTPKSLFDYEIQAVVEDPSVHTAEDGLILPAPVYSQLPKQVTKPVVKEPILARMVPGSATRALFSWTPAPNAESYQLEMAEGDDPLDPDVTWTRVADTTATATAAELLYQVRTMIRIRAIGLAAGPWIYALLGELIPDFWLTDETPFWADDDAAPFWSN